MRRRDPDREGFAALLPVLEDDEAAVREVLQRLNDGATSPFASLSGTHFVRLVVLPPFGGLPALLFFAAEFDAVVGGFLEALCTVMPDQSDEIFGRCLRYPGTGAPPEFKRWMLAHRVRPGFTVIGNPGASADEVERCLLLRQHIIDFALETRDANAAELSARWAEQDWETGG
jgi:hypothetical protein